MKLSLVVVSLVLSLSAIADQEVYPPLTADTLVGTWEALPFQDPATLWHMEINKTGDSYLAQITVGTPCIVRRLISSEVHDGKIRLHFDQAESKDLPGHPFPEIWINGTGSGIASSGILEWTGGYDSPRAAKPGIFFIKGTWTRDVADASKTAEKEIKERTSAR